MDASPISIFRSIDALARVDDRDDSSHMSGPFVILVPGFMTEELYYDSRWIKVFLLAQGSRMSFGMFFIFFTICVIPVT